MILPISPAATAAAPVPFVAALRAGDYSRQNLRQALQCRGETQQQLFALARERRRAAFPREQVEARSVIELSNVCQQACNYCSMAKGSDIKRYIMGLPEVLELADHLYSCGRRVLLLQSGENNSKNYLRFVTECVGGIKQKHPDLTIILCMGNYSREEYRQLRDAGADRYVLKFETSSPTLYARWKPSDTLAERLRCLELLLELGFQVGSGNMVGMPGQTLDDLVDDLLFFGRYPLAMMSCTVFIPGDHSNYRNEKMGDVELALNSIALMRIMYPHLLMPTTSCLQQAKPDGQYWGLMAGANTVTIHDGTPARLKKLFPIYSSNRFTPNREHFAQTLHRARLTIAPGALI